MWLVKANGLFKDVLSACISKVWWWSTGQKLFVVMFFRYTLFINL
jgi:hypothetical protein